MDTRTEEQKLAGIIPVRWGGEVRNLPTLKRGPAREWKAMLGSGIGTFAGVNVTDLTALGSAASLASDEMLKLLRAYDPGEVLGSEEWIDAHVDDVDIYDAFRAVLNVSFPFVQDLRSAMAELRGLLGSVSPVSTNGASPSGASTRKRSTPALTTPS